jgi:hypothetical protein
VLISLFGESLADVLDGMGTAGADGFDVNGCELCIETVAPSSADLGGVNETEDESVGVQLLCDVRMVFDQRKVDRISTADLLEDLVDMEESPWGEWRKGLPIANRGLARLLKPYGIRTRNVRFPDGRTPKGLLRGQFEDAWRRYAPSNPLLSATAPQHASQAALRTNSIRHTADPVADEEPPLSALHAECGGVADKDPVTVEALFERPCRRHEGRVWRIANGKPQCGFCHPPAVPDVEWLAA